MIGETLSHYRVLEKIGAGGMGEVYRAHDERLDRDVALKVLPAGMLADATALKLFRREAQTLSKLNHPNISTVHDFDSQDGVNFLVMEYISGTTLDEKLAAGPLSEREIVHIGVQLAQGLQAAHNAGVVHRDLKPANLRITPDGRLKILDFGLAKLVQPRTSDITQSITGSHALAGTLPYMAPEQLQGEAADTRSDIYAAGAVLYEMVTGQRPFPETYAPRLIDAILHQQPRPPSAFGRRVPGGMQSLILKALAKDPEHRYQSARELRVDLERLSGTAAATQSLFPEPFDAHPPEKLSSEKRALWHIATRRPLLAAGLAGIALILALFAFNTGWRERLLTRLEPRGGTTSIATGPIQSRRSVAVLGFKNLSKEPGEAWVSEAFSDELTSELAAVGKLRTIPGETVSRMKADLSLADAETYAPDTLDKIRRSIGTDLVVFGSYLVEEKASDKPIRLDLRVQDTKTGETIASMVETGTRDEFNGLVDRAGRDLRQQLNTGEVSAAEAAALHASLPANSEVARLYSEGLTKLRLFDAVGARDLLQKAVEAEPGFALAHSALAEAWADLGNDSRAREEVARALDLSSQLSREDQLLIQGRYRELNAEWEKAIETYRSLWQFFPDNLDYGLRLANVQSSAGRGQDALATVGELRKLPPPARDDARVDLEEATAAKSLSDFKREDAAGERATKKAQGARLLSAQGLLERCWALYNLGKLEEARKACDQAKDTFALAGDRKDSARAFTRLAEILEKQGDGDAALRLHELALQNMREVGSRRDIAGALVNIAILKSDRGDAEGARTDYEEAVRIAREDDDKQHVLEYENDLGSVFYIEGDFARANQTYEQVLTTAQETDDKGGVATALSNMGLISYLQGDLPTAQKRMQEALNMEQKLGMKSDASSSLDSLADVLLAQGDLDGAEKNYREALGMRQQLGAKGDVAGSKVSLARLAVEKGRAAEAETLAREAVGEFQAEKIQDSQIGASEVLVRSLMAQGKLPEAESTMERTLKLRAQDHTVRLSLAITGARLAARSGRIPEAMRDLEGVLKEASRMRLTGYAFEARLAEAEIELQQGKVELAHSHLQSLEKEAARSGFRLIARKAVSVTGGAPRA